MERREENEARVIAFPAARARPAAELGDLRFRTLLGEAAWAALPETTRARFGKRIADCRAALYAGEIVECRMNLAGRHPRSAAARLIGGPLPLSRDAELPAMVAVTEDMAGGGQSGPGSMAAAAASRRSSTAASASPGRPGSRSISAAASASRSGSRSRTARSISSATIISSPPGRLAPPHPALAGARPARGQPYRLQSRPVRLHARADPQVARRDDPADRRSSATRRWRTRHDRRRAAGHRLRRALRAVLGQCAVRSEA